MSIHIEPDELKSTSRFPNIDTIPCPGLEALTGADFVVSTLPAPIMPTNALDNHIKAGSYFVQRKSNEDALSFDQLKRSISRMKKCGIPAKQCVLLLIGNFKSNKSGVVQVGRKSYSDTRYMVFCEIQMLWAERGGVVYHIPDEDHLSEWIAGYELMRRNVKHGDKNVYPDRPSKIVTTQDNGFQIVNEIASNDLRYILQFLPGFGYGLVDNVIDALQEYELEENLYYALLILTTFDDGGKKPLWKVKGVGNKKMMEIRSILYGDNKADWSLNIRYRGIDEYEYSSYAKGFFAAIDDIAQQIGEAQKDKKPIKIKKILKDTKRSNLI